MNQWSQYRTSSFLVFCVHCRYIALFGKSRTNAKIFFNECKGRKLSKMLIYRDNFVSYRKTVRFESKPRVSQEIRETGLQYLRTETLSWFQAMIMIKTVFVMPSADTKKVKLCCRQNTFLIVIIYLCYHKYKENYGFFKQNISHNNIKALVNINKLSKKEVCG